MGEKYIDLQATAAQLELRNSPPSRPHVMYQRWEELLFLHWEVDPQLIAKDLPSGLKVDTFDGRAYLGIVPFFMKGIRPRFLPAVPGISNFERYRCLSYRKCQRIWRGALAQQLSRWGVLCQKKS